MDHAAVFGVGSTNFRAAVAAADGSVRTDVRVEATRPRELETQLVDALQDLRTSTTVSIDAVGASIAGLVDHRGVVRAFDTPDGETIDRVDVRSILEDAQAGPVTVENDGNAAALGEYHYQLLAMWVTLFSSRGSEVEPLSDAELQVKLLLNHLTEF